MTRPWAAALMIFAMTGLAVGQDVPVTMHNEEETAFVYPTDGDQPFGMHADDVVHGSIVDSVTGEPIQEITWRGIEMHHERGFTSPGWVPLLRPA